MELHNKINEALSKYYNEGKISDYKGITDKVSKQLVD